MSCANVKFISYSSNQFDSTSGFDKKFWNCKNGWSEMYFQNKSGYMFVISRQQLPSFQSVNFWDVIKQFFFWKVNPILVTLQSSFGLEIFLTFVNGKQIHHWNCFEFYNGNYKFRCTFFLSKSEVEQNCMISIINRKFDIWNTSNLYFPLSATSSCSHTIANK